LKPYFEPSRSIFKNGSMFQAWSYCSTSHLWLRST